MYRELSVFKPVQACQVGNLKQGAIFVQGAVGYLSTDSSSFLRCVILSTDDICV